MRIFLTVALSLAAAAAQAQPPAPTSDGASPPHGAHGGHRRGLFISPAGEPFRGPDGLQAWFARADADHDGTLSRDEFLADAVSFFRQLDVNHDGVLDAFELQAYERDLVPEITGLFYTGEAERGPAAPETGGGRSSRGHGGMGRGAGRGGGPGSFGEDGLGGGGGRRGSAGAGREGAGRFSLLDIPEPVTGADLDVDGKVTLAEWRRAAEARFAALDTTKTGKLTLATLPQPPNPEGGRRRHGREEADR